MRFFFVTALSDDLNYLMGRVRNVLIAYHILKSAKQKEERMIDTVELLRRRFERVFMDSGGAYTSKGELLFTHVEYADFIEQFIDDENMWFAMLDYSGDDRKTLATAEYFFERFGVLDNLLPVLQGRFEFCEARYARWGYPYWALGWSKGRYARLNDYVVYAKRLVARRKIKLHGFAKGSMEAFRSGAYYSIDSASWASPALHRVVLTITRLGGRDAFELRDKDTTIEKRKALDPYSAGLAEEMVFNVLGEKIVMKHGKTGRRDLFLVGLAWQTLMLAITGNCYDSVREDICDRATNWLRKKGLLGKGYFRT